MCDNLLSQICDGKSPSEVSKVQRKGVATAGKAGVYLDV